MYHLCEHCNTINYNSKICGNFFCTGKEHTCNYQKQIVLFTSVIGVCNCGKEKTLEFQEIKPEKQD